MKYYPQTRAQILAGCVKPVKEAKKVANNTYRILYEDGTTAIRYHDTDVVVTNTGTTTLTSGGFRTNTTKDRLCSFGPYIVYQISGLWYVKTPKGSYDFFDGITFDKFHRPVKTKAHDIKLHKDLKKKISKFVAHTDTGYSNGRCQVCGSDVKCTSNHLLAHVENDLPNKTMVHNALRHTGYQEYQLPIVDRMQPIVRRALRKYLMDKLKVNSI